MPDLAQLSEAKRNLLQRYLHGGVKQSTSESVIGPRLGDEPAPLGPSQEQLILRETSGPGIAPLYNECIKIRMVGPLDVSLLQQSLCEIVRRHEAWRTSYRTKEGRLVQVTHPAEEVDLQTIDVSELPRELRDSEAEKNIGEIMRKPFDLRTGPLLSFRLIRITPTENWLFLITHLSIVDGVSAYQVFPRELAALYDAFSSGRSSPLAPLAVQFGDFAYWQRNWLQSEDASRQLRYWRGRLGDDLPTLEWPATRPRSVSQMFRGKLHTFTLPKKSRQAVVEISRREGVTKFATLTAAFAALMHRYTDQNDIVIGTPSPSGRKRAEVAGLLGYFLNPVALRFQIARDSNFHELTQQARGVILEAMSNDQVPIEMLAQELGLRRDGERNPFFRVAISLQPNVPDLPFDWTVTSMDVDSGGSPWDLYIAFIERPGEMLGRVQYAPEIFEAKAIVELVQDFTDLLEQICTDPAAAVLAMKSVEFN
jgi:hypothetical protein